METIRELLARLATLNADELAQLRAAIVAEAERLDTDEASVEDVALLQELAGFGEQVMAEQSSRDAAQAQAQADREAARERIRALNPPAEEETEETPAGEGESEPAAETEGEPAAAEGDQAPADAAPVPVAASGGAVARMAARQAQPTPGPEATTPARNRGVLTATGALRGLRDPSAPIENRTELARAMTETLQRLPRHGAPRGDVLLASVRYEYPEERRLGSDAFENSSKMDAVNALTATGGICLPVNVDYSVPTWSTADRPLRDSLPSFEATRGGIRFVQPPDIAVAAAATGIWTEATDASPGAATKPIATIQCGTEELVYVEAVSTRLGFGNMQARFSPEQVAAFTDLAMDAAARVAENNLLNLIAAACVPGVTAPVATTNLGATRDLLSTIYEVLAGYRNAHRIPRTQTMTAIFPDWVKELIRADLAREAAHQQDSSWNSLSISDEQVESLFTNAGINPVFHLDGQPAAGLSGGVSQAYGLQAAGQILTFPAKLVWYLFPEGQMQFLDGGRLDLGVVRDSTLDATNDFETFVETFEGLAFRGFNNGALQMVTVLCANGQAAGSVSTSGLCA